jgi:hypothetical protein
VLLDLVIQVHRQHATADYSSLAHL